MTNEITVTLYLNSKLDELVNIKVNKLYLSNECGAIFDSENPKELLKCYSSTYVTDDVYSTIDVIIMKLSEFSKNSEIYFKYDTPLPSNCFSKLMIVFKNIELEERKINFTDNPHKQHIHVFNRGENGMIRIKEQKLKALLDRTISILKIVKDEIWKVGKKSTYLLYNRAILTISFFTFLIISIFYIFIDFRYALLFLFLAFINLIVVIRIPKQ